MDPTGPGLACLAMLHDASLLSIELDWSSGTVALRLRSAAGLLTLVCRGGRHLEVPRAHPWGPSVSVNEAAWRPSSGGGGALQVEMQTGDVIRVVCDACEVQVTPGG